MSSPEKGNCFLNIEESQLFLKNYAPQKKTSFREKIKIFNNTFALL